MTREIARLVLWLAALLPCFVHAENYSDMWFNPNESGWGVTIADHETNLFAVWYTYDTDGSPMWFSMPGGRFNSNRTYFTGDVYRTTGPSFTGPFDPNAVVRTKVGTAAFDFAPTGAPAGTAVFSYTVGPASAKKQIQRLSFGSAPAVWGLDKTDLWWNSSESGWGLTLAQHGNNVFGAWFTYAPSGRPLFIIMPGVTMTGPDSFTGTLYTTTGPSHTAATFDPAQVRTTPAGTATVQFNGDTGTFTATAGGVTQTKTITRLPFGAPSTPKQSDPRRVEDTSGAVRFSGPWVRADSTRGWSGGSALQSATAGATASITFNGTSIRWIGGRGRTMGIATVSVDGGPPRDVNTFGRPSDEIHSPIYTIYDLSPGQHTLTITVTGRRDSQADPGNLVVVDAFDIQPDTTISRWQETDPNAKFTPGWTKSSTALPFSGTGLANVPELPVSAMESETIGNTLTLPFRGTAIGWVGYRGPDAGIALVQVDGGGATEVDLYSPITIYQPIVFSATGLTDANHTLTIQSTGRRNPASSGARVVVDAFEVTTPGRRYEEEDPSITYVGTWTHDKRSRVWTEGVTATSNVPGSTATFSFTGTSVSWIGCRKGSAGGTANIYVDGTFVKQLRLSENYPIEGYQMTVFRQDGLMYGAHTLKIEVINTNGSYVVVDAFDVHP